LVPSAGKWYTYTIKVRDEISGYVGYLGIWRERNKRIFMNESRSIQQVMEGIYDEAKA
jgi:hypothetical protein